MSADAKAEEEAVFDRQMRLWGADAQNKLRGSRVLVRGAFLGLASELTKNLVLAGVNVSIMDDSLVTSSDAATNIFLRIGDVGKPRAVAALDRVQEMNPFAQVKLVQGEVENLADFTIVVSVSEKFAVVEALGKKCRAARVPLIVTHSAGLLCYAILDVGESYTFGVDGKPGETKSTSSPALTDVLNFSKWSELPSGRQAVPSGAFAIWLCRRIEQLHETSKRNGSPSKKAKQAAIEDLAKDTFGAIDTKIVKSLDEVIRATRIFTDGVSFAPVATICGGVIGQEILKVVSGQGEPVKNLIFFDGIDGAATVRLIPSATKI